MVDHRLSKGIILCPTITAKGVTTIIFQKLLSWFGLFDKIISDCGPHFSAKFSLSQMEKQNKLINKLKPISKYFVEMNSPTGLNTSLLLNLPITTHLTLSPEDLHFPSCTGIIQNLSLTSLSNYHCPPSRTDSPFWKSLEWKPSSSMSLPNKPWNLIFTLNLFLLNQR